MHVTKNIANGVLRDWAIRSAVLFCLCAAVAMGNAAAAIYACPLANGDTTYQDHPCAKKSNDGNTTASDDSGSDSAGSGYPLGMHPSWFITPAYAPQPAYCDRLGCDCASLARNFRHGLAAAVADALFLEATWHRYAEQVIEMETDPPKGMAYFGLQGNIADSACEIQMSQTTLKNYADVAFKTIEKRALQAKRRGNTDFDQCDGSNEQVCADVDAYSLYERVQLDLQTLSVPRDLFVAGVE